MTTDSKLPPYPDSTADQKLLAKLGFLNMDDEGCGFLLPSFLETDNVCCRCKFFIWFLFEPNADETDWQPYIDVNYGGIVEAKNLSGFCFEEKLMDENIRFDTINEALAWIGFTPDRIAQASE